MKIESRLFYFGIPFFILVDVVYGFMTKWDEWVGILGILLVAGLAGMIGFYFAFTGKRVGKRPEDRSDGEIYEGAGEQGQFSPWSWWPIFLAFGAAMAFLGLALGWWILFIALGFIIVGLIGWVYEYSRGDHAH